MKGKPAIVHLNEQFAVLRHFALYVVISDLAAFAIQIERGKTELIPRSLVLQMYQ
jgi:hypothetical protein